MTDTREWRVGTHYNVHVYAKNLNPLDDDPICTAHDSDDAKQIVEDHNRARRWIQGALYRLTMDLERVTIERNHLAQKHKQTCVLLDAVRAECAQQARMMAQMKAQTEPAGDYYVPSKSDRPVVGDKVRHRGHGSIGTLLEPGERGEWRGDAECRVRDEATGHVSYWFEHNIEPAPVEYPVDEAVCD